MLLIRRGGAVTVVKDWGRRSAWVRLFVAPWLARHEAAMLRRADGVPGVPRLRVPVDRLALAMEYVAGRSLRRRVHGRSLPPAFFDALEAILDGLARRGVAYLDLRSPTNVLVTAEGTPALVDLGSAIWLPLPRGWILRLERRALAKLRSRFEQQSEWAPVAPDPEDDTSANLKAGGTRFCLREHGSLDDPLPTLFLPPAGLSARLFAPVLARAASRGRRAIGVDLPGFGGSRRDVVTLEPARVAEQLEALLDALRVRRVDLVGAGWGALVGRALAARAPGRVRRLVAIAADDSPARAAELALRRRAASSDPEALRARLFDSVPADLPDALRSVLASELSKAPARNLVLAYRDAADRPATPFGVGSAERVDLDESALREPERIWSELGP